VVYQKNKQLVLLFGELLNKFIMNYQKIKIVLIRILFLNWLVAFAKIFIGVSSGAISILTDGIHSFFDGASNIIGIIGIHVAQKPSDKEHPYGHQKYEAIASLGILFLLVITVYELIKKVYQRFLHPSSPEINILVFSVLGFTLIINYFVARYEFKKGEELKSIILKADSFHTKSDIFVTAGVILGALATKLGWSIIDPIFATLIIFGIIKMIFNIYKEGTSVLCDASFIEPEKIKKIAQKIEGVKSLHKIRTRGSENYLFLDMHLVLDPDISLIQAHKIAHNVKKEIQRKIPLIKDVTIHIEPEDKNKVCVCD